MTVPSLMALQSRGSGIEEVGHQTHHRVTKLLCRRTDLESPAGVGNSPVSETHAASGIDTQVTPGPSKLA